MKKKLLILLSFLVVLYSCNEGGIDVYTEEPKPIVPPTDLVPSEPIPPSEITLSDKAVGLVVDIGNQSVYLKNDKREASIPDFGYSLTIDNNNIYHLKKLTDADLDGAISLPFKVLDSLEIISGSVHIDPDPAEEYKIVFANTLKIGMKPQEGSYVAFSNVQNLTPVNNMNLYYYGGNLYNCGNNCKGIYGDENDVVSKLNFFNYLNEELNIEKNNLINIFSDSLYVYEKYEKESNDLTRYNVVKYLTGNINSKPFNIKDESCNYGDKPLEIDPNIEPMITVKVGCE